MQNSSGFRYYDYFFVAALLLLSFWFESHVYFNWDASWHLEAAKRIVHGGASYSKNLYDDNLPMVFWYFIPVVLLHHITGIFIITLALVSIHFSVLLCFILCNISLSKIYAQSQRWKIEIMRYTLLISLLFFPGEEFGQRDMMVTTFVLPYIFLIAARLTNRNNFQFHGAYFQVLLGLFAAIGIAMNPFYGLIIIALEIQLWLSAKKIMLWRPEMVTFIATYVIYLLLIQWLYPDYYTQIIPSYLAFSPTYNVHFWQLIATVPFMCFAFATLIYFAFRSTISNAGWVLTLWLSVFFSCVVYLLNGKLFQSHIIFLMVCSNIFFIAMLCEALGTTKNWALTASVFYVLLTSCAWSFLLSVDYYQFSRNAHSPSAQILSFFNQDKIERTILILSTQSFPMLPLTFYTKLQNISPWSSAWTIRAIALPESQLNRLPRWKKAWVERYKKIFISQVGAILQLKKPDFVFVNVRKGQGNINEFSFVNFLDESPVFRQSWKSYRLVKVISHYQIYARSNGKVMTS